MMPTTWRLPRQVGRFTGDEIRIAGTLAGLHLEHTWRLPCDRALAEERITLRNASGGAIALSDLVCGLQRMVTDDVGRVLSEVASDRFVAVPLRHRATDAPDWDEDFDVTRLLTQAGREHRANARQGYGYLPSLQRFSEGWAWTHGAHTLGVFKFSQETMEYSILGLEEHPAGLAIRFGGAGILAGEPSSLGRLQPGEAIALGVTRYQTVKGDFQQAMYAFRAFLDENGCRFPPDYNPPLHWNELYDNPEWSLGTPGQPEIPRHTRALTYTRAALLEEAARARDYSCEALYLDPGWDTDMASFLWGKEWLGDQKEFVRELRERYGLSLSLHCPLAQWLGLENYMGHGIETWPREIARVNRDGQVIQDSACLGSRAYLDEAERRLLALCADGATFLMFDGNAWHGECWNRDHGHPVPYTKEDHCRANLEEIHIHVLPDEGALVVNIFNLSNESRLISGKIAAEQMGLPIDKWYVTAQGVGFDAKTGMLVVNRQ